jgi:elongation factor P
VYSITDLKKDTLIVLDGIPFKVVNYNQKQMGRGGSIVNTKLKNLLDGRVLDKTFKGSEKVEPADVSNQNAQFLYRDGERSYFMDNKTYDQFDVPTELIGDSAKFLKEGQEVQAQLFNGRVINVSLPIKVELKIDQADPAVKGDTVSNVLKSCIVETGANVQVPLFINAGDTIVVDTRDGSYVERKKG